MVSLPDGTLKPITRSLGNANSLVIIQSTSKFAGQKGPLFRPVFLKAKSNKKESSSCQSDDETDKKIIHFTDLIVNSSQKKRPGKAIVGRRNQRRFQCDSPFIPDYRKKYNITTPRKPGGQLIHRGKGYIKKYSRHDSFVRKNFNNNKPKEEICPWIDPGKIVDISNAYKLNILQQVPNVFLPTISVNDLQMLRGQTQARQVPSVVPHAQPPAQLMLPPAVCSRTAPEPKKPGILGTTPYSPIPESFMQYQKHSSANQSFPFGPSSSVERSHLQGNRPWSNNRDANIPISSQTQKTRASFLKQNIVQINSRNISKDNCWEYESHASGSHDDSQGNFYENDFGANESHSHDDSQGNYYENDYGASDNHQSDAEPGNPHHFHDGADQQEFQEQDSWHPEWQNDQYFEYPDDYRNFKDHSSPQKFEDQKGPKSFLNRVSHPNYLGQNSHQGYRNHQKPWEKQQNSFKGPVQRGRGNSNRRGFRSRPNRFRGRSRRFFEGGRNNQKNNFEWRTMAQ